MLEEQLPKSKLFEEMGDELVNEYAPKLDRTFVECNSIGSLSRFVYTRVQPTLKRSSNLLPTSSSWYILSMLVSDFLLFKFPAKKKKPSNSDQLVSTALNGSEPFTIEKLQHYLKADNVFSSKRAQSLYSQVKDIYYRDLPTSYTTAHHRSQLSKALHFFYSNVRGPMVNQYRTKLVDEFNNYWNCGHRHCDSESLTGHPCKYTVFCAPISLFTYLFFTNFDQSDSSNPNRQCSGVN